MSTTERPDWTCRCGGHVHHASRRTLLAGMAFGTAAVFTMPLAAMLASSAKAQTAVTPDAALDGFCCKRRGGLFGV